MPGIRVVSFDLWDTVLADDSDEPKRERQGLPSKRVERRNLVYEFLNRHGEVDRRLVDCAYDTADAAFRHVWHTQHHTWPVAVRLQVVLNGLKRQLPDTEFHELVRLHEDMELRVQPDLVEGAAAALRTLARNYTLVVVSDAIFSPGRALRELLERYGLKDFFSAFVFSDELGCSKPDPRVFQRAAELAGCSISEIVHVGDREHNDVAGPKAAGAKAVLFTAAIDRGTSGNTAADATCRSFADLPKTIDLLDQETYAQSAIPGR